MAEGLKLYLDEWELAPGREFQPALAAGLRDSKTCVVFLGPNGLAPWQKQELQVAIDRRARDEAFRVIPVLLPGAERPRRGRWRTWSSSSTPPGSSSSRRSTTSGPSGSLVWGIGGEQAGGAGEAPRGGCPYRGLEAFRPEDAKFFFGRENLTGWLVTPCGARPGRRRGCGSWPSWGPRAAASRRWCWPGWCRG